jgi:DNA replication and repair protein RecF
MLTDIRLQHFRSYDNAAFEFGENVNIIIGPNGSGKTNLLEAILLIARGSSYRAKDASLVKFDEDWARLDGHTSIGSTRVVKLTPNESPAKTYELDGKTYKQMRLDNTLPVVLFEPDHLRLLSGGPDRRREYLDDLLEQTISGFGTIRRQYARSIAQRNRLLKTNSPSPSLMFPWDIRISQLGGQIALLRSKLVEKINEQARDLYGELTGAKTNISFIYDISFDSESYETKLLKRLEETIERDQLRGFTGSGPHREDLVVNYNSALAQVTASRGESRSIILVLKVIELELLRETRGVLPILLLDDVFSELDGKRRHKLTDRMSQYQTFITTTDADVVLKYSAKSTNTVALG